MTNQKRPPQYHTRQGQIILDYMRALGDSHVTVNQLVHRFAGQGEAGISQTTIYRHLEKLLVQGKIRKYFLKDGESACYQYVEDGSACREHFHLRCEVCGDLIHADCELLDVIDKHLLAEHDFQINALKTVLYGTCKKCLGKK
ncbi:MAG: transcriptional repressor [Treponema sp.]|jgi:Fur family ferric uptake transcriptional regulator|nr:transcriptional repressor [Treponema sp.]